jgi:hypothetical protein
MLIFAPMDVAATGSATQDGCAESVLVLTDGKEPLTAR